MSAEFVLSVRHLVTGVASDERPGPARVLVDDVSFDVARGRVLALVGQCGSGKSLTALSILQSDAPPMPFEQVEQVIEEDLGAPIAELFDWFSPRAIAAASADSVRPEILSCHRDPSQCVWRSAPTTASACTVSATSCTRSKRAPRSAARTAAATLPATRSAGGA